MKRPIEALQSEAVALRWIEARHPDAPATLRYRAAARAASAARQAVAFRTNALCSSLEVQPLLHYYAVLDAVKVLLHLYDLRYPASTAVLQHGLSTRRAKRESYAWVHDTVSVYKEGVFQSCAAILPWSKPLPQRFIVGDLLGCLPWMRDAVARFHEEYVHLYPVVHRPVYGIPCSTNGSEKAGEMAPCNPDTMAWYISRAAATRRNLTVDEWRKTFGAAAGARTETASEPEALPGGVPGLELPRDPAEPQGLMYLPVPPLHHPWTVVDQGILYVCDDWPMPRWMLHLVLLYSLSVLCRYHPSEWSDILHWHNEVDAYLVRCYLEGVDDAWHAVESVLHSDVEAVQ
jgi:hypothetical protein